MPYGLYISAEGAMAQNRRLEVLSNNLANVDTVGFKRHLTAFQARFAEATEQGLDIPGLGSPNDIGGGIQLRETKTDFSQGPLKSTGVPTDMAIPGEGFFLVQKGDQQLLTRAGNFSVQPDGTLVTQQGYPVLADGGGQIQIDPTAGPWTLQPDGTIAQGGTQQPLAIMQPASLADLTNVAENLFQPQGPIAALDPTRRSVRQGYLEASGVRPTLEMMELIETSRAFEANANMIRNQDQMLGQLVSRVLKD